MELTVMERMGILGILGPEGSFTYLKAKRDIVEKVGFTADENVKLEVVEDNDMIRWNPKMNNITKEIKFSGGEAAMIVEALKKLETDEKLHENYLTLYEKFVEN